MTCGTGFNAVRFDLPFIGRALSLSAEKVAGWAAKCIDPYLALYSANGKTCKLQRLLDLNGLGSKTGTGADAIMLARYVRRAVDEIELECGRPLTCCRQGRTRELLDYCMTDVLLTHALCELPAIRVDDDVSIRLRDNCIRWEVLREYRDCSSPTPPMRESLVSSDEVVAGGFAAFDRA